MNAKGGPSDYPVPQKLVFLVLVFSPVVYMLLLLLLQQDSTPEVRDAGDISSLNQIIMLLGIVAILGIAALYLLFLPRIIPQMTSGGGSNFGPFLIVLTLGSNAISIYGLIIGVLQLECGMLNWPLVLLFFTAGMLHGIYLYLFRRKQVFNGKARAG